MSTRHPPFGPLQRMGKRTHVRTWREDPTRGHFRRASLSTTAHRSRAHYCHQCPGVKGLPQVTELVGGLGFKPKIPGSFHSAAWKGVTFKIGFFLLSDKMVFTK